MIKRNIKKITTSTALFTSLLLAGCATTSLPPEMEAIKLESVDSNSATIPRLYLYQTDGTTLLRGDIKRRIHAHGEIPGHLHIELISADGKVLKEADTSYKRKSSEAHDGSFEIPLPASIPAGSTIRVTHHDLVSHQQESVETPWRDVNRSE